MDDSCPTLTYNLIGRHQSRYITTRVASIQSPWMLKSQVGDLHTIPISHGEGRFVGPKEAIESIIANGQVATQYVDANGQPTMDITFNPNGSTLAIEGVFSPDGRVFGKMGHLERSGEMLFPMLASIHNLHYYLNLMREARAAIESGTLADWEARFAEDRKRGV